MRTRRGVTAIEIILIVAIVCLLVAIAFPWFTRAGRQQAGYDARRALEQLRDAEDAHFAKHHTYAAIGDTTLDFRVPPQLHITVGGDGLADGRGWNATAVSGSATCYVGVGVDTVIGSVRVSDGRVLCP
jgi:type II secretory pathway pseudopilin PulG